MPSKSASASQKAQGTTVVANPKTLKTQSGGVTKQAKAPASLPVKKAAPKVTKAPAPAKKTAAPKTAPTKQAATDKKPDAVQRAGEATKAKAVKKSVTPPALHVTSTVESVAGSGVPMPATKQPAKKSHKKATSKSQDAQSKALAVQKKPTKVAGKAAAGAKPPAAVKPKEMAKPAAAAKPKATAKPAAAVKPKASSKPAATKTRSTASKPKAQAKSAQKEGNGGGRIVSLNALSSPSKGGKADKVTTTTSSPSVEVTFALGPSAGPAPADMQNNTAAAGLRSTARMSAGIIPMLVSPLKAVWNLFAGDSSANAN